MARPRTPTEVLEARGSFNAHPERRRPGQPDVAGPLPPPPERLPIDVQACWKELAAQAPEGVLTAADAAAMEMASQLFAEFREFPMEFPPTKMARLQSLLGEFGMTPAKRAAMSITKKKNDKDPFDFIDDSGFGTSN